MKVKKHKKTLTVIIILTVALIMFSSFFGVKITNKEGIKKDLLPNYKLGMEFTKKRVITATVSDEVNTTIYDAEGNVVTPEEGVEYTEEAGYKTETIAINEASLKNVESYKKTKSIIEERLNKNKISESLVVLDEETGKIKIEIPENTDADTIESMIKNSGTFMLLDGETFEVVLNSDDFEKAEVMYSQGDLETAVFLQIEFNEEGTKKLNELNKIYVETTSEQTNENGEVETVTTEKMVWVILNDAFIGQTVLPNIVYDNKIMLTFGTSNNNEELQVAADEALNAAILLNSGTSPLLYEYTNEIVNSNITHDEIYIFLIAIGLVFFIAYVGMVIRFKAKGFIATYFQIGFLAILLLVLRLTNVIITMEGIAGIVISMVLEYIFTYIVLTNINNNSEGMYKKSNLQFFFNTFPIYVVAVVFTFATKANISSFGMSLFWGIILIYLYNFIFSKFVFDNLNKEANK